MSTLSKIDNLIGSQPTRNGARPLGCKTRLGQRRRRVTVRLRTNSRGENNGHRPPAPGVTARLKNALGQCLSEDLNRTRQAFMISAGTSGSGAPISIKAERAGRQEIGAYCAVGPGRRAIDWRCNRLIATSSIAMIAM